MTTSFCFIAAVGPSSGPLWPGSQKPQHSRHTWAAAGPPLATLNILGLLWELRLQRWMYMYMRICTQPWKKTV